MTQEEKRGGYVDISAEETANGWKAKVKAVTPNGTVDEFERIGYASQEEAISAGKEAVFAWMLKQGLTGTVNYRG